MVTEKGGVNLYERLRYCGIIDGGGTMPLLTVRCFYAELEGEGATCAKECNDFDDTFPLVVKRGM